MSTTSNIQQFYNNNTILLTGGTGYLGTVLIEKIIRSFPNFKFIYFLVRKHSNKTIEEREKEYFNLPVFIKVKHQLNNIRNIKWIECNFAEKNLGLSDDLLNEFIDNVNVIIHNAASTALNDPLKVAVNANVLTTLNLINFAKQCKQLKIFTYVSTVYTNIRKNHYYVKEKLYETPIDGETLLDMCTKLSDDEFKRKTQYIFDEWIGSYSFVKNVAENMCADAKNDVKFSIFRPSIVVDTYAEPFPYWSLNPTGLQHILNEFESGFFYMPFHTKLNVVPCDYTINALLASTCYASHNNLGEINIFNYIDSSKLTMSEIFDLYLPNKDEYHRKLESNFYKLFHLVGKNELSNDDKIYLKSIKSYSKFTNVTKVFVKNSNEGDTNNIKRVWSEMSDEEKLLLPFDLSNVDWETFFKNMKNAKAKANIKHKY